MTVSPTKTSCKIAKRPLTTRTIQLTIPTIHELIIVSTKALQTRELLTTLTILTMIHVLVPNKVIGRAIRCGSTAVEERREPWGPAMLRHTPSQRGVGLLNGQCSFIKANGERCRGTARGLHGLCWAHAPENAAARRRAASRGGRGK